MSERKDLKPTALVILDGFGYRKQSQGNAIAQASMPTWDMLVQNYPHTLLHASGEHVGLLPGFIGNSEVGHLTMGAGRIIKSVLKKFHDAIDDSTVNDGSLFKNKMLIKNLETLKQTNKALHLMGLVSTGGVHSHQKHLHALVELAGKIGIKKVFIHAFLDGRDVPPTNAAKFLKELEAVCKKAGCGSLASLHGRFYAMDRDKNWDRTKKTYDVLCGKTTLPYFPLNWEEEINKSYDKGDTDEFLEPVLLDADKIVNAHDGIIFFNFRADRAQQLAQCFLDPDFNQFESDIVPIFFITTTRYKNDFKQFNNEIIFEKDNIQHTLLDELAVQAPNKKVFIIAETEKYAHVTYFFKGMRDETFENEQRTLVPSIKVKTYVDTPEMSADKITQHIVQSLQTNLADFYLVNYANPDMVGHSGNLEATIKACECTDRQLKVLYKEIVEKHNGTLFITADHGNAEEKIDEHGKPKTSHTTNPVPFVMVNKNVKAKQEKPFKAMLPTLGIAHIAPTILKHLELVIPKEMNQETIF